MLRESDVVKPIEIVTKVKENWSRYRSVDQIQLEDRSPIVRRNEVTSEEENEIRREVLWERHLVKREEGSHDVVSKEVGLGRRKRANSF
jgi:hypothetical protein